MFKSKKYFAVIALILCGVLAVPFHANAAEILQTGKYGDVIITDEYFLAYDDGAPGTAELVQVWENDPYWELCGMPLDGLIMVKQDAFLGIIFNQTTGNMQGGKNPADFAADIAQYNAMKGALAVDPQLSADYQAQQAALKAQQEALKAQQEAQLAAQAAAKEAARAQGVAVMQALAPQIQWAGSIAPLGSYTPGTVYGPKMSKAQINDVKAAVETFVGSYITPEMTDYQKICAINDYLSATCTYAPSWQYNGANTAWGALVYGEAQCSGYSRATKALCDAVGIPCYYIRGDLDTHQWNKVMIGGKWYVADITNSVSCMNMLFLCSDAKLTQIAGDTSFNSGTPAAPADYPG